MAHMVPSKYSAASELRAIALGRVAKSLPCYGALPVPIMRLLVDEQLLLESVKRTTFKGKVEIIDLRGENTEYLDEEEPATIAYNDYSFVMAPAYKAFEGYLIFLSDTFGLPTETYKNRIGGLYDWEANAAAEKEIVEALEAKLGTDKEGKDRWRELSMVLRTYRHNPAHFLGDKVGTFEQAEDCAKAILNTINQMTKYLIDKEVLHDGDKEDEAICDVNNEQVR